MLLPDLRKAVLDANLELVRQGLVLYTFGNASGISRKKSLVVIKPSGVPYERLRPADLVITDLNGKIVEGKLRPSSDLPTHLIFYKSRGVGKTEEGRSLPSTIFPFKSDFPPHLLLYKSFPPLPALHPTPPADADPLGPN